MPPRRFPFRRRLMLEWALVACLASVALMLTLKHGLLQRADNIVYDYVTRIAQRPASDDIVLVVIDDESLGALGRWPFPREHHARLLHVLSNARPRAIVYDVLFPDPDPRPAADAALAAAIGRAKPLLPLLMEVPGADGRAVTIVPPAPTLAQAAGRVGHVNLAPDADGLVRRFYMFEGENGLMVPHLGLLAACSMGKAACTMPSPAPAGQGLLRAAPMLIPFAGPAGHFRRVSFSAAMRGQVPAEVFRDRVVLVGFTATGTADSYSTPVGVDGTLMPGVELNANILAGLLEGHGIAEPAPIWPILLALLPLWLLLTSFLVARPTFNSWFALLLLVAVFGVSAMLFTQGVWVSPVAAVAGILGVFPVWGWRRLQAATGYMRAELKRFGADADAVPARRRVGEAVESDIDLLRRTIARVRELRDFIDDTLDGLPDATLVVEPTGAVRIANERARLLMNHEGAGLTLEAALHRLTGTPPPRLVPGEDGLDELTGRDGRIYSLLWSCIGGSRAPLCWVLRLADVTALRTATRQREEALQLLTHDMRSPQAAILATLSMSDDIPKEPARRIEAYARRTLDLADGFVQLARADAKELQRETFDLSDALLDAADEVWPLAAARRIRIETDTPPEELLASADRSLLTRALINLIGNAVKYSPEDARVTCRAARQDGEIVFTIEDQGRGLAEDEVKALFQPFRRFGADHGGAGLGLMFVQSVATRHEGSVRVRSTPGQGATFELRLPSEERAGAAA